MNTLTQPESSRMPSLFVSHGAPTFALEGGLAGPMLTTLGGHLPKPKAVLVLSPHWMTSAVRVATTALPRTIHDFGGFDPKLYDLTYPAPGHPDLAQRTVGVLQAHGWAAQTDPNRGLDHGAWVPLLHLYPRADVPVFQVSMPTTLNAETAWGLGQALAPLSEQGVLLVASGSITHNLYEFRGGQVPDEPYVAAFAKWVGDVVRSGNLAHLKETLSQAPEAARAHPTAEHFWPLLVAAGAASAFGGHHSVLNGGIAHGMLAMDSYVFGSPTPLPQMTN
jgi:4,5-DOPA dioxygenase extradiol